jgi:D-sedoheptulose 7-phosphate isomerase
MNKTENNSSLQALYPFLHDKETDSASMNGMLLNSITQKISKHQNVIDSFFKKNSQSMVACAKAIASMYKQQGSLFVMGNGGSSSDASHIAVEFLHPVTTGRPALPAFDLSCDKTLMSAIANDVGYDQVFSRQVSNLIKSKDALIGVSTSGNSGNLLTAFITAKKNGVLTIGLCGGNGGEMAKIGLDHCLIVESDSIHRTQECHVAIYHLLWDLVHTLLADERGCLKKTTNTSKENENEIC